MKTKNKPVPKRRMMGSIKGADSHFFLQLFPSILGSDMKTIGKLYKKLGASGKSILMKGICDITHVS